MALAERVPRSPLGHAKPRLAPPIPARSDLKGFRETASSIGIQLMPWQETSGRYLTATGPDGRLLYSEVCIVVARQNGKTTLMRPLIIRALLAGKRIMHIAQTRELPRQMFKMIADAMEGHPELLPRRRGKILWPRYGAGQEEVVLNNGGSYRIASASRGGARGTSNDLVIVDELREMIDYQVLEAAQPTLAMSDDSQMIYLSNAGEETSVVLNAVRARAGLDPSLAYLEWSASPERAVDDLIGWAEANPALGHYPSIMRTLEQSYRANKLSGTLGIFETEYLCRWVVTTREPLVDAYAWMQCRVEELPQSSRPVMAVSMDPEGKRASVALAWRQTDDTVALRLLYNVTGNPIDPDDLGKELRQTATRLGVGKTGFDPLTDAELAKYLTKTEAVTGRAYANASSQFVNIVAAGKLRWHDADAVTDDLTWTARKPDAADKGSFEAVRAKDDRPIPASLAAIRAVWLASGSILPGPTRIY